MLGRRIVEALRVPNFWKGWLQTTTLRKMSHNKNAEKFVTNWKKMSNKERDETFHFFIKRRLNMDTQSQNFWWIFLENDYIKQKNSTMTHAITTPLSMCFSFSVLSEMRRDSSHLIFQKNGPNHFISISRSFRSSGGTPSVISQPLNKLLNLS